MRIKIKSKEKPKAFTISIQTEVFEAMEKYIKTKVYSNRSSYINNLIVADLKANHIL